MLRVALCNDAFIPIIDGVGRVVYEYAHALGERGHECYVIAPQSDAGYRAKYPFDIIDFSSVGLPGNPYYRTGVATMDRHYMTRVSTIAPDIIHAHSPGPAGMEAVRLASKLNVPLIGTFHSKFYDDFLHVTHSESLAKLGVKYVVDFFSRCDEVWAVSNFAADLLREYGFNGHIEIVQNGVNVPPTGLKNPNGDPLCFNAFNLDNSVPIIFYAGQLSWKKNLQTLLECAAILHNNGVKFKLVMAGQGPDENEIFERAYALLPEEALYFTGHITNNALLWSLYEQASLFLFPSQYDTSGLVVHEAATVGTPSLVVEGSALADVITNGINGFVTKNSPEYIASAIGHALSDPKKLRAIGNQAKSSIPIPWDTLMNEVVERYEAIIDRDKDKLTLKRGILRKQRYALAHSLESRSAKAVIKFMRKEMQDIYAYAYSPNSGRRIELERRALPLPRVTPETMGVNSGSLLELYRDVDRDIKANVQGLMVLRNGNVLSEGYWAPYGREIPHQLYSMSKSVTSTAIGMLYDEGKINLDERIVDIFADKVDDKENHPQKDITIRHLLNMSTGVKFNEIGSALGKDWVQEYLNSSLYFAPGSSFYYNSMNSYMLAAIVTRKTGMSLMEYLAPRLFEPLQIVSAVWETCPQGIEKGGWGLSLTLEDVAKIGLLYMQKGKYVVNGVERQLLSEYWVKESTAEQITTPNGEMKNGYGYQIWRTPIENSFLFSGAYGQYMLAIPDKSIIVCVFSGASALFAQSKLLDYVGAFLSTVSDEPINENPGIERVLQNACHMLSMKPRQKQAVGDVLPMPFSQISQYLNGAVYDIDANKSGLLPVALQSVSNNYSNGISSVSFSSDGEDNIKIIFIEDGIEKAIYARAGAFTRSTLSFRESVYTISTGLEYGMQPTGGTLLQLFIYFVETPMARVLRITFEDDNITIICDETPSLQDSGTMLMELASMTMLELFRGIMPLLKSESVKGKVRAFTIATLSGKKR